MLRSIYTLGDKSLSGHEIVSIFGDTGKIAVLDTKDGIRWEMSDAPLFQSVIFENYHKYHNAIPSSISYELYKSISCQLAAALFLALTARSEDEAIKAFDDVKERLKKTMTPNQARMFLFGFTILSSLTLVLLTYAIADFSNVIHKHLALCSMAGILGSTLSALQRSRTLEISEDEGIVFILFQAIIISMIGLLSGVSIYIVSNSELAFSFAKDNIYNLLTISVVAGFTERFIPDLFSKVSQYD